MQLTSFKEKNQGDAQYFLNENNEWEVTSESHIMALWHVWVCHPLSDRYIDEQGYLVFTYKNK